MRLLFLPFAAALLLAWYAYLIRPVRRTLSNRLLLLAGALLALLLAAFARLI